MAGDPGRTGVLVLRIWTEGPTVHGFRARISIVDDVTVGEQEVALTSVPAEVLELVRAFVDSFTEPDPPGPGFSPRLIT